jgi:hypothetical protein
MKGMLAEILVPIFIMILGFSLAAMGIISDQKSLTLDTAFYPGHEVLFSVDSSTTQNDANAILSTFTTNTEFLSVNH